MKTSDFDYDLPAEYIAQTPVEPRDASRLLVVERASGRLTHAHFYDLEKYLRPGDVLVINETRVIPARLYGRKIPTGGRVELLLLRQESPLQWEVLVGGKGLRVGQQIQVDKGPMATITAELGGPRRSVRFSAPIEAYFNKAGNIPLPPYIHEPLSNPERYQTIYARLPGSAAAPTAGLHFTPKLIARLRDLGVIFANVTLHVGLDTFAPVNEDDPLEHKIHSEWCQLTPEAAAQINHARQAGGRIVAVGTTSVRTLESAARSAAPGETVAAYEGSTDLFILPGHQFKAVDTLITNFHLPRSTLVMLVSAFWEREKLLAAYETAKQHGYRFYSFGDAMLLL